jgi:hypothetical protein
MRAAVDRIDHGAAFAKGYRSTSERPTWCQPWRLAACLTRSKPANLSGGSQRELEGGAHPVKLG